MSSNQSKRWPSPGTARPAGSPPPGHRSSRWGLPLLGAAGCLLGARTGLAQVHEDGRTEVPALADPPSALPAGESRAPAHYSWADVDGDGRLDLAAVNADGRLQLLTATPDGRFEDVTERFGLADVEDAALTLWADYDADGRLDFLCGARGGASRLFHNEGGLFTDMSAGSGFACEGAVQSAQWLDRDGDGPLDLFVVTAGESGFASVLFQGLAGGFFEREALPLAGLSVAVGSGTPPRPTEEAGAGTLEPTSAAESPGGRGRVASPAIRRGATGAPSSGSSAGGSLPVVAGCVPAMRDQSNPGACIQAASTPTLGRLYPLSSNLFVAPSGEVGIGTTTPATRLDVAGTARITDALTLNPSGDTALDVSTGSIYKAGTRFLHTRGGIGNTALGLDALANVTGSSNTASGASALRENTTGVANTATGRDVLRNNTSGRFNTSSGVGSLDDNLSGDGNAACGFAALGSNVTGSDNIAVGNLAGFNLLLNNNIAIGNTGLGTDSGVVRIGTPGTQTQNFQAGIRGVTTGVANAIPVVIDSNGQLGTVSSSRRFKEDIRDMGDATERLLELRPVLFRYKQAQSLPNGQEVPPEYGLIAEEVAEVFPDLVVYDDDGQPFTVKYHLLSSMLLNELEKLNERCLEHDQSKDARLRALEAEVSSLKASLQTVLGNR